MRAASERDIVCGMEVFTQTLAWIAAGKPCALATVVGASGSTPRRQGAHMVVAVDGRQAGTVGGGRVEHEAARLAAEVAAGEPARVKTFHLTRDLAMCCGGTMEIFIAPATPRRGVLERVIEAAKARDPILLETSLASGAMTVQPLPDGFGRAPVRDGDRFVQPLLPRERALLFGAGHVGWATGMALAQLGFEVVLCDDNDTGAINDAPEWASRVVTSFAIADVVRAMGELGAGDYAIIATRDHAIDQRILEELCARKRPLAYLGVIGSLRKVARFRQRLEAKNLAIPENLAAPIGIDIGAETPEEIAVSIAAELIAVRAAGTSSPRSPRWSRR